MLNVRFWLLADLRMIPMIDRSPLMVSLIFYNLLIILNKYNNVDEPTELLQKLYNDLTEKGLKSRQDALEVGKTIEITDINDLEKAKKLTTNSQIKDVYSKLIFASNNHLRSFNRNLSKF